MTLINLTGLFDELDALERNLQEQMDKAKADYERQLDALRKVKLQLGKCRASVIQQCGAIVPPNGATS